MNRVETVEEFLARGGQIQTIPRGAMAEAGWTPAQLVRVANTGNTGQGAIQPPTRPEDVPVTGVHRVPNQRAAKAPKPPKAPKAPKPKAAKRVKPVPARRVKARLLLQEIVTAVRNRCDTAPRIAKYTGQTPLMVSYRLGVLKREGRLVHTGARGNGARWSLPE